VLRSLVLTLAFLGGAVGGAVAAQPPPVVVSLLEADPVRIGEEDGAPAVLLVGIVGAVLLPSGELAAADGGDHAIRFFDRSGALVRTVGREGAGPGEFRLMNWFGRCADGDLLATDVILGRATVLDPTGQVRETVVTPEWFRFNRVLACGPGKQLLVLADHPRHLGEPGKVTRFPAALVRFTLGSDRADTLALVAGNELYYARNVQAYSPYPLGAAVHAAAHGNWAYLAQNDEAFIRVFDLEQRTDDAFFHHLPTRAVTAADWRTARAEIVDRQPLRRTRQVLEQVLEEATVPRTHPPFMDLKSDRAGRLWVRLPADGPSTTWMILTPQGEHIASLALPSSVEPLDVGSQDLIAVERDDLGVQRILWYTLPAPFLP
jgi:hypothetical protein